MRGDLHKKVIEILEEMPGQAIKEISTQLNLNRTFLAGYLQALEDMDYVISRKVGPARIFMKKSNHRKQSQVGEGVDIKTLRERQE